jgi:hypothetical protein
MKFKQIFISLLIIAVILCCGDQSGTDYDLTYTDNEGAEHSIFLQCHILKGTTEHTQRNYFYENSIVDEGFVVGKSIVKNVINIFPFLQLKDNIFYIIPFKNIINFNPLCTSYLQRLLGKDHFCFKVLVFDTNNQRSIIEVKLKVKNGDYYNAGGMRISTKRFDFSALNKIGLTIIERGYFSDMNSSLADFIYDMTIHKNNFDLFNKYAPLSNENYTPLIESYEKEQVVIDRLNLEIVEVRENINERPIYEKIIRNELYVLRERVVKDLHALGKKANTYLIFDYNDNYFQKSKDDKKSEDDKKSNNNETLTNNHSKGKQLIQNNDQLLEDTIPPDSYEVCIGELVPDTPLTVRVNDKKCDVDNQQFAITHENTLSVVTDIANGYYDLEIKIGIGSVVLLKLKLEESRERLKKYITEYRRTKQGRNDNIRQNIEKFNTRIKIITDYTVIQGYEAKLEELMIKKAEQTKKVLNSLEIVKNYNRLKLYLKNNEFQLFELKTIPYSIKWEKWLGEIDYLFVFLAGQGKSKSEDIYLQMYNAHSCVHSVDNVTMAKIDTRVKCLNDLYAKFIDLMKVV